MIWSAKASNRVGGRDKFFHCHNCGLRDKHSCIENSTKNSCPVCYEYLFDSVKVGHVMRCGHTMHMDCFEQMINEQQYRCPFCSKSMVDLSSAWQSIDHEVAMTATRGAILCSTSWDCGSYNTRRISTPQDPVCETV